MLDAFFEWGQRRAACPERNGVKAMIKMNQPCDNRSARMDFDTSFAVAEIIFWESEDYFAQIISIQNEESLYSLSGTMTPEQQFDSIFEKFFEVLETR